MGNDRLQAYGIERQEKFQSTFPRGERPDLAEYIAKPLEISIHVPSWGTTIHRHAEVDYVQFQSTFPRGERPGITMTFTRALPFQSTFPRGERRGPYLIFLSPCRFQSTFPRGERHLCWLVAVKHIHFNPRSLVGNDYIPVGTYTIVEISIHVPSWGTTRILK